MLRTLRWVLFAVLVFVPGGVLVAETVAGLPAPSGYVNDFAGVLSAETRQTLEELCTEVDHQAHAQIAVVTVKSLDADGSGAVPTIEEFATALEDKWKVGAKGTDRGVLLIFISSTAHGRIEVGYGLEGILNDAKVGDIGREMHPLLQSGDFNQGVSLGVHEVAQDIATDAGVTLTQPADGEARGTQYAQDTQGQMSNTEALLLGGLVILVVGVLIRTGHIGWLFFFLFNMLGGGGRGGGGYGGGGFGGGGGGGEGGGFGGFGGGSSGGGGANF